MKEIINSRLNESQRKAVTHFKGPCLVLAGPGSGKTLVITERIKCLIENHVEPRKILVITFTKAAAEEMRLRFKAMTGGRQYPVQFGTFHAIFFSVLKHAYHYNVNNIIKEEWKRQFFKELLPKYAIEIEDENEFISDVMSEISLVKGEMISLQYYYSTSCPQEVFVDMFQRYERMLRERNLIDFDDMLVLCYELFKQRPDILKMWQQQFQYIQIDEFQDINKVQYEIIKMLALPENNLFIVGDDDQSIYRFRGACPEIMLNFKKDYPDAGEILLDVNYRCSSNILEGASRVIVHNQKRFAKEIHSSREKGELIHVHGYRTLREENQHIIHKIRDYAEQGYKYSDMAVLFRTNTQPQALVEMMMSFHIPFRMKDVIPNIYEHWITRDIINYIRIAHGNRERNLFLKLANRPKRYISREAFDSPTVDFEQLYTYYEDKNWMVERIEKWEQDLLVLRNFKPYSAINFIRKGIEYDEFLREYAEYRRLKAEDLYEVLDEIQEAARPFQSYDEWFDFIREYTVELKKQQDNQKMPSDGVVMSTMHSSKGLEYPIVFIIDANEEIMPHKKSVLEADIEEERRMFYVAMTRAKDKLHISYVKERYNKELERSRFLEELFMTESENSVLQADIPKDMN